MLHLKDGKTIECILMVKAESVYAFKFLSLDDCQIRKTSIPGNQISFLIDNNKDSILLQQWERRVSYDCENFDSPQEEQIYFMQEFVLIEKERTAFFNAFIQRVEVGRENLELYSAIKDFGETLEYLIYRYQRLKTPTIPDPQLEEAFGKSYASYGHFLKGYRSTMNKVLAIAENKAPYFPLELYEEIRQSNKNLDNAWLGIVVCMDALGVEPTDVINKKLETQPIPIGLKNK
jgi:hypothetical protein